MYDKQQIWQQGSAVIAAMVNKGVGAYVEGLPDVDRAFHLHDLVVRCMDGRTPGGVHLAGSGVLLGKKGARKFAAQVASKYGKLEAITYHADCGAAAAIAKKSGADPFVVAENFARELGGELGIEVVYEVENKGWEGFHHERVVYYDGTGRFDWQNVPGLPVGFVISRAYLDFDVEYAKKEIDVAAGIALKPHDQHGHGFGEMFTANLPLLIIPIGESAKQLALLTDEAQDVVSNLPRSYQGRVKIDGFVHRVT